MGARRNTERPYDLLVVGAGIAGLSAALEGAKAGRVCLVSAGPLETSSASWLAQGGIAAALDPDDSPALHFDDTVRAGRGLCRESAVSVLVGEAPSCLDELVEAGVELDEGLGLEGGHSRRRIARAGGAETGARVAQALARCAASEPRIEHRTAFATSLWGDGDGCIGAITDRGPVAARATLLATGGMAGLWARTTNPRSALGHGALMAYRAGAALADLELVQFHPTVVATHGLLVSEALRGEGALLLDESGARFTDELAPRDVVSRAVDRQGAALLDLRPIDPRAFPSLMARLRSAGFDPTSEPIPVAPAAHYTMGGIVADLDGRTGVPGLYAAGECACTGVHGANRLASNSLLECLVFSRRAAIAALRENDYPQRLKAPPPPLGRQPAVTPALRRALWEQAGLVRDAAGLERLRRSRHPLARLVAEGALAREESRGGHFRIDFPAEDERFLGHVVHRPGREPVLERWR